MECIICKKKLETLENKEEKLAILEGKKKLLIEEIERLEKSTQMKGLGHRKKELEKIITDISLIKDKRTEDKFCPRCEELIGIIVERKIDEKMGYIMETIQESIIIDFDY